MKGRHADRISAVTGQVQGALNGVIVVEVCEMWAGPLAARFLADHGAEVIKVERPEGDMTRHIRVSPKLGGEGRAFVALNWGKRSVVLDLHSPEGIETLKKLVGRADVFMTNLRPRVRKAMGLEYEDFERLHPRLIYAAVSGFGEHTRWADWPGYDYIVQARSGVLASCRDERGRPIIPALRAADIGAGQLLAQGVALALYERERSGRGQKVDTSLVSAAVAMQASHLIRFERDPDLTGWTSPATQLFQCKDGAYIILAVVETKHWMALCKALELGDLEKFDTFTKRVEHASEIYSVLGAIFATQDLSFWLQHLMDKDIPCGPVLSREEALVDEIISAVGLADVDHPRLGPIRMMAPPIRLSRTPPRLGIPAPALGEHSDEILRWVKNSGR